MAKREPEREVSALAMYRAGRLPGLAIPFDTQPEVTPLELYGAKLAPDLSGRWVYAFADRPGSRWSDGRVWYAGQSDNLWSRWRDHFYRFKERFTEADKWLVPAANEAEADLFELVMIHFYDPECNDKGRRADLAVKARAWARGTRTFHGPHVRELDPGQVSH